MRWPGPLATCWPGCADTTAAISDIRRLIYGLRPPALDDLGLIGSLREQSTRLALRPDVSGVAVTLNAPDHLPALPAAVEVAAYRIITEAMTNAVRHSGAGRIEITLGVAAGARLSIEVRDDGTGPPADWQPGVGVTSMRERAAELGGSCRFEASPGGGGQVIALLPVDGRPSPAQATLRTDLARPPHGEMTPAAPGATAAWRPSGWKSASWAVRISALPWGSSTMVGRHTNCTAV
jgi:signal transduction histidine kinase